MSKITNGSYTVYYSESRGLVDVDSLGNVSKVAQDVTTDKLGTFHRYDLGHISDNPEDYRPATQEDINEEGCVYLDDTLHRPLMTKDCRKCPDRHICLLSEVEYPYLRKYSKYDFSDYIEDSPEEKAQRLDEIIEKMLSMGLITQDELDELEDID
jgi:hypothetical protein